MTTTCSQAAIDLELMLRNALGAKPEDDDPDNIYRHIFVAVGATSVVDIFALTRDDLDSPSFEVTNKDGDKKLHPTITHLKHVLGLAYFKETAVDLLNKLIFTELKGTFLCNVYLLYVVEMKGFGRHNCISLVQS